MEIRRLDVDDLLVDRPPYVDAIGLMGALDTLQGKPTILFGPKGTGKTMGLEAWAADHDYAVVQFGCTEGTREKHLYGALGMEGGNVFFTLGCLTTAIDAANELAESGDHAGVMLRLDEINSLTPQMQKGLNSFADWQQSVAVPSIGRVFKKKKGAVVWPVGSMNPSAHGGVFDLNEDLKSRFRQVWIPYPQADQERVILRSVLPNADADHVEKLLSIATETRQGSLAYQLSPRDLVQCLEDAAGTDTAPGMGLERAIKLLSYHYDEGTDRDTFHARVLGSTKIDLTEVEFLEPPANLTTPHKAGVNRKSGLR